MPKPNMKTKGELPRKTNEWQAGKSLLVLRYRDTNLHSWLVFGRVKQKGAPYLEDGLAVLVSVVNWPMVIVSPRFLGLWDPFQRSWKWLRNGGDPNYWLIEMILQVDLLKVVAKMKSIRQMAFWWWFPMVENQKITLNRKTGGGVMMNYQPKHWWTIEKSRKSLKITFATFELFNTQPSPRPLHQEAFTREKSLWWISNVEHGHFFWPILPFVLGGGQVHWIHP